MRKIFVWFIIAIICFAASSCRGQIPIREMVEPQSSPKTGDIPDRTAEVFSLEDTKEPSKALENDYLDFTGDISLGQSCLIEYENNVYYISLDGIQRYDIITGEKVLLLNEDDITSFVFSEGDLHYIQSEKIVKKVSLDGKNPETIFDLEVEYSKGNVPNQKLYDINPNLYNKIFDLQVEDGQYYMKSGGGMIWIKFSPETGIIEEFENDASKLIIHNGYAYFIDHAERRFNIHCRNIESGEDIIIKRGVNNIVFIDDQLYYYSKSIPHALYRYVDGLNDELILQRSFGGLATYKNELYYTAQNDETGENALYKINPETREQRLMIPNFPSMDHFIIADEKAFYGRYEVSGDKIETSNNQYHNYVIDFLEE